MTVPAFCLLERLSIAARASCGYPPSEPLVDGTSFAARGSIATAARNARASPLKQDSAIWWSLVAVQRLDVQRHAGVHGERLKPLLHQLGVEGADLVAHELRP